jgi:hypothetical protein
MRILKTIAGLATSAFMATSAMGQEQNLEP